MSPKSLAGLASFVATALTLAACKIDSNPDSNAKMYCRLACDTLFQSHSSLPPYKSAWDCKKACDEKLEDPRCASVFQGAGYCFHLNCEGTFGAPVPPHQCEQSCGPQLQAFFDCQPSASAPDHKASVSATAAKILPESDRDAREPNSAPGSTARSAR